MSALAFGLVNLAIAVVIFWAVSSDRVAAGAMRGPFGMRRQEHRPDDRSRSNRQSTAR